LTAIDRTSDSPEHYRLSDAGSAPGYGAPPSSPGPSVVSESGADRTQVSTGASALTWALVGLFTASLAAAVAVGFAGLPELAMAIASSGTAIAGSIQLSRR
jgi:hypothetical protein